MDNRHTIRYAFLAAIVIQATFVGLGMAGETSADTIGRLEAQSDLPRDERAQLVGERDGMTVATGQASPTVRSKALVAWAPNGTVYAYEPGAGLGDVDPSPRGDMTVMHPEHTKYQNDSCDSAPACSRQSIRITNLTTGERETLTTFMTAGQRATNWHDVDKVPNRSDSYIIASIAHDRVWQYNISTGETEWAWHAQSEYNISGAGPWPQDWTHLNDVDVLPDGRVMISLRNHDQVVFIKPGEGLQEDWTLGCDDCHGILFEQHNPDYIPASRGGPAVLVADSENNRIVEYQRRNGSWEQSWTWDDGQLDWPRDADRLPNGHTLIADSHENRVLEVNQSGSVVWSARMPNPYNVERLGTGDGSTGGESAAALDLPSRGGDADASDGTTRSKVSTVEIYWNKIQFIVPDWMGFLRFVASIEVVLLLGVWGSLEAYWAGYRLRRPWGQPNQTRTQ